MEMWEIVLSKWFGVAVFILMMFCVWLFCDFSQKKVDEANAAQQRRDKSKKLFGRK